METAMLVVRTDANGSLTTTIHVPMHRADRPTR